MAELNWSLARVPDYSANALQFAQAGREQGIATAKQNALALYAKNPNAGIQALTAVDPVEAASLRQDQQRQAAYAAQQTAGAKVAAGDYTGAVQGAAQAGQFDLVSQLSGMNDAEHKRAAEAADGLANYAQALKGVPPEQRKAVLMQDKPTLVAKGLDPGVIDNFDPTDQNIDKVATDALGVKGAIARAQADRTAQMTSEQNAWTRSHGDATLAHTVDKDNASLGIERQKVGLEAARVRIAQQAANGGPATSAAPPSAVHGDAYLGSLPADQAAQVKALATGRMAFPTGTALKAPYWQQMLQAVANYDPNFDAVNYNARAKARSDFTSGKSAQNIKALNTAIGHLGRLDDQIDGTASFGGLPGATALNAGVNALARSAGSPGVTNYEQTASALATELTAVFRGSGGAEADVKRYLDQLNSNASKSQKKAAVANISTLLHSRLEALGDQYQQGMGTTGDKLQLLNPEAQKVVDRINNTPAKSSGPKVMRFDAQGNLIQ